MRAVDGELQPGDQSKCQNIIGSEARSERLFPLAAA